MTFTQTWRVLWLTRVTGRDVFVDRESYIAAATLAGMLRGLGERATVIGGS